MKTKTVCFAVFLTGLLVVVLSPSTAQNRSGSFIIDIVGLPDSLKRLCEAVPYIVEVRVDSVLPTSGDILSLRFPKFETDAVVSVDRLLKGDLTAATLVVGQPGGSKDGREEFPTQYELFQPGQRYILFLSKPREMDGPHADRPGFQRLSIFGVFSGMLKVDGGKVYPNRGTPPFFQNAVYGKPSTEIIAEILSYLPKADAPK